ncbi:MAG: YbgC/FadM family acyl-CoA thioesterase [Acidobacteria bacterium]|nr:YbgC/FadM family acyl-CoA thioesterase [Acidobacteriota bacterium]
MSAARHSIGVEVRYAETDAMGIVHHSNYLVWFELARTHLCRQTGKDYAAIERDGHQLTVTRSDLRYRRPARYGDSVVVTAWIDDLASRRVRFGYEVQRTEDLLTTGTTEHIWIDRTGRPCRGPEALMPAFRRLAGIEESP